MNETKTLNEWVRAFGMSWVDGREVMLKGEMSEAQARDFIQQLHDQGAVK